jgi:hypothetical protein
MRILDTNSFGFVEKTCLLTKSIADYTSLLERRILVEGIGQDIIRHIIA